MNDKQQFLMQVVTPTVLEFNNLIGNTVDKHPLLWDTYLNLIREEGKEYFKAVAEGDLKEQLDAVCDLLYVGTFFAFITGEKFWHEESWVSSLHSIITNPQDNYYSYDDLLDMLADPAMYKFDIEGAFARVTESNFTKAPKLEEVNIVAEVARLTDEGRYSEVSCRSVGNGRVVFTALKDNESGEVYSEESPKIIKPSTFKSVEDLGGLGEFITLC